MNDTPNNNEAFNQYDQERFQLKVAQALGITVQELKEWMINDIERVTEGGKEVGHMVVFRESTPESVLEKLKNRQSHFTALTGLISGN